MCLKLMFSACHGADTGVSCSDLYSMAHFMCGGGTKTTQCGKILGGGQSCLISKYILDSYLRW